MFCTFIWQFLVLFSLLSDSILQHTNHWDYQRKGPDTWHYTFDACEGKAQSPIDIRTSHVKYDPHLNPLSLNGYTSNISSYVWNFTHNGHNIVAYPPPLVRLSMNGSNLPEVFYLVQFHFHWGYHGYQGSEHTIDGHKFPLEIHFVHQAHSSDDLAVLSILFNLRHDDNPHLNDLLSVLNQTINTSISIEHRLDISHLFPTVTSPRFYRYNGSLTTPPCTEGVTWTILAKTVPISAGQLEVFIGNSVPFNFRPTQKLHARKILANFRPEPHEVSEDEEGETTYHSSACLNSIEQLSLLLTVSMLNYQNHIYRNEQ
jgi:carbonic anhydrase